MQSDPYPIRRIKHVLRDVVALASTANGSNVPQGRGLSHAFRMYGVCVRFIRELWLILTVIGAAWLVLPVPSQLVEDVYSRKIFPVLSSVIVRVFDLVGFSVVGVMLIVVPILLIFLVVRIWRSRQSRFGKVRLDLLWRVPLGLLAFYGLFVLLWGANYRRLPIEQILNLPVNTITASDLEKLASDLVTVMQKNANAPRDSVKAFASLRASLEKEVEGINGVKPVLPLQVKSPPAGWLLLLETSGVISPLTLEAHVDAALPEPFFLATAAHELAHTAGFAGEADTDLLAALAGLHADDPYAKYTIAITYYARVSGDLSDAARKRLAAKLPARALEDFKSLREVYAAHQNPIAAQVSRLVYNKYLESQGVSAGIRDYSRVTKLLSAARAQGRVF
jgi:hypothetical protein